MRLGHRGREALRRPGRLSCRRGGRRPTGAVDRRGVTLATLEAACGAGVAVVRSMPNTPALVGEGASAIAAGAAAGPDDLAWAETVLSAVGTVVRVPESQLDAVTGLAGSGPAYLFLVAEALMDAGVTAGLPGPPARRWSASCSWAPPRCWRRGGPPPTCAPWSPRRAAPRRRACGRWRTARSVRRSWRRWPPPPHAGGNSAPPDPPTAVRGGGGGKFPDVTLFSPLARV